MTTRLLVAFDPWMLLTGDECVVALMGNHLLQGTLTSGYFYGQHYGLSILEASCCALGLLAGGWHTAPIKISILLLFVPAVCLLMKTVTRLSDWRWGAAAGIAFLTLPAWTIWSLQARGGYLTAFCASMGAMYIASMDDPQRSIVRDVCMVGCLTLVVLGQMTWIAGLLVVLFGLAWRRRRLRWMAACGGAALCTVTLLHLWLRTLTEHTWNPPGIRPLRLITELPSLPSRLWDLATSHLFVGINTNQGYQVAGLGFILLVVFGTISQVRRLTRRSWFPVSHILAAATVAQAAACLTLPAESRYLLPVLPYAIAWLAIEFSRFRQTSRASVALVALAFVLLGTGGVFGVFQMHFRPGYDKPSRDDNMHRLAEVLVEENFKFAFTQHAMLMWQLTYYSSERITCRWIRSEERIPGVVEAVNDAFIEGEPTVLIGTFGWSAKMVPRPEHETYGVEGLPFEFLPYPELSQLEQLGFEM